MENYVKLYQRILQSSVWKQPSDVRIVWITLLALKDENGCVFGSVGWLSDQARVKDEVCERALSIFCSPDNRSRTVTNDGRKIVEIDGGWQVLNHLLYRDGIETMREKWRRQKADQRARRVPAGSSFRQEINRRVNEDPITKADRAAMRRKNSEEESPPKGALPGEVEYDLADPGDLAP